jgi:hypothetical protein
VVAHERQDPILNAEAGKNGGILRSGLAIQIELGCPPGAGAIFEFDGGGSDVIAAIGFTESGLVSIPRLPGSSRSWE